MPHEFGAYVEWKFQRMFLTSIFIANSSEAIDILDQYGILNNTANVNITEIDSYFGYVTDKMKKQWLVGQIPNDTNADEYIMKTLEMERDIIEHLECLQILTCSCHRPECQQYCLRKK